MVKLNRIPTDMIEDRATGQTLASQLADIATNVKNFGTKGDGVTDDATSIQSAINAAPKYATIHFDGTKTYYIKKALTVNKPLKFNFNGCKIILDNSASPNNRILSVIPTFSSIQSWTQTITKKTVTLTPIADTSGYTVGDTVAVLLGEDPYDSTQPHWTKIAKITAVTSNSLSIDSPVEYDVNAGTRNNKIQKIDTPIDSLHIENVTIDFVNGSVPDTLFEINWCKNISIKNFNAKKASILFLVINSENVTIENVDATLSSNGTPDSARFFGTWHSRNVHIKNVTLYTAYPRQVLMVESANDGLYVDGMKIFSSATGVDYNVFDFYGKSINNNFKNVEFNGVDNPTIYSFNQGSTGYFENLTVTSTVKSLDTSKLRGRFSYNGVDYEQTTIYRKQVVLNGASAPTTITLPQGIYKQVKVYISSLTGITSVFLLNSGGSGFDIKASLVAGSTVVPSNFERLGSDYPFNSPTNPTKRIEAYTDATTSNVTLGIFIEYYPINNDVVKQAFS